jgi:hypothetical protein
LSLVSLTTSKIVVLWVRFKLIISIFIDYLSSIKPDKYINYKTIIRQLRLNKKITEEQFYNPVNLNYSKVDVPLQMFCRTPNTRSLHKYVDTPSRETFGNSFYFISIDPQTHRTLIPDIDPMDFEKVLNERDEEMGISQESTSEDNNQRKYRTNAGNIRKMSVKTSELFKSSIQLNHKENEGSKTSVRVVL